MIRHQAQDCTLEGASSAAMFIDCYMAKELQTVVERDPLIPDVVYKFSLPMTDGD